MNVGCYYAVVEDYGSLVLWLCYLKVFTLCWYKKGPTVQTNFESRVKCIDCSASPHESCANAGLNKFSKVEKWR